MAIEFRCVQCQKLLRVGDDAAGKKARCPDCGTIQEARGNTGGNIGGSLTGFSPKSDSFSSPSANPSANTIPPTQPQSQPANPFSEQVAPSSPFGQSTTNPYLAPQFPDASLNVETIRSKVRAPAIGMLMVAVLAGAFQL